VITHRNGRPHFRCHPTVLKQLPLLLLTLFPLLSHAQVFANIFQVSDQDASLGYINSIFGQVTGTLTDESQRSLMGDIFNIFNAAVMSLGGLVVAYTYVVSTIASAHEGETLGKNWSSIWIPFRTVAGIALMIPANTGYNILQGFFFWVITQSIGAADVVWSNALDYLKQGGQLVLPAAEAPAAFVTAAGNAFQSLVCSYAYPSLAQTSYQPPRVVTNYSDGDLVQPGDTFIIGPYDPSTQYPGVIATACGTSVLGNAANPFYSDTYAAVLAMTTALSPIASHLVTSQQNPGNYGALYQAATSAWSVMFTAAQRILLERGTDTEFMDDAKKEGWISAGSYYYDMLQLYDNTITSVNSIIVSYYTQTFASYPNSAIYSSLATQWVNNAVANLPSATGGASTTLYPPNQYTQYKVLNDLSNALATYMNNFMTQISGASGTTNPILGIQKFGADLLTALDHGVIVALLPVLNVIAIITGAADVAWYTAVANILLALIELPILAILVPIVAPILIPLFLVGAILAFYVPLIPFMVFTFAAIGWLVSVIETMIAAPLVALGVVIPEGTSQVFGKAEPAVMLIVSVFLRPTLMLFGMITALGLSYISIRVLNLGIYRILDKVFLNGLNSLTSGLAIMILYGLIIMSIITKSFNLIHIIPDRLLRWIGGGQESFGSEFAAGAQEIKGGFESGIESAFKGASDSLKAAGDEIKDDFGSIAKLASGKGKDGDEDGDGDTGDE